MNDRTVSIGCLAAIGLWGLTVLLILAGTIVGLVDDDRDHLAIVLSLMAHGLACSAAAATVSIRYMFNKQNRLLRSAFELGRDAAAGSVRSMRP